jgi:hypothetical protein
VGLISGTALISTLFKIDWLVAFFTDVFTVELIGKYFCFGTAFLAFADK